jgi:hypothetical protein
MRILHTATLLLTVAGYSIKFLLDGLVKRKISPPSSLRRRQGHSDSIDLWIPRHKFSSGNDGLGTFTSPSFFIEAENHPNMEFKVFLRENLKI